jgi:hypothetical protein
MSGEGTGLRRVCIDARLQSGVVGGVQQLVIGLAVGLSSLRDGDEEYLFLADEETGSWLAPYIAGRSQPVTGSPRRNAWQDSALVGWAEKHLSLPLRIWRNTPLLSRVGLPKPLPSDGIIERTGAAVAHFPTQLAVLTSIPSIYHPHDLQHLHLPQFFSPR